MWIIYFKSNSRTDGTDLDIAETGVRIWILIDRARTVWLVVQPGHLATIGRTSPHGHGQDHASPHSLRHAVRHTSLPVRLAVEAAVVVGQAVETVEGRLLDSAAVLDVEALNLFEIAVVCSVDGHESGDDSESLSAVQLEARTAAVKILGSTGVSVECAAVRITLSVQARMRRVDIGQTVGLPNVQLVAGRTAWLGRLGITIACSVSGSSVARTSLTSVAFHRNEIQGGVHSASASSHVHFERELLVEQVEHAIPENQINCV